MSERVRPSVDFEARAEKVLSQQPLLSAKDVEVTFSLRGNKLTAIRRASLDLYEGETLAIVGESGSGKSVFTKTFSGMLDSNGTISGGSITLYDKALSESEIDLTNLKKASEWQKIRGRRIATVFQDPMTSLNPILTIGKQMCMVIEKHQGCNPVEAKLRAIDIMQKVGIDNAEERFNDYPFMYSGGKTTPDNLQMLCKHCNRTKSGN